MSSLTTKVWERHCRDLAAQELESRSRLELQAVGRLGPPLTNPTLAAGLLYSYSSIGRFDDVARLAADVEKFAANGPVGAGT